MLKSLTFLTVLQDEDWSHPDYVFDFAHADIVLFIHLLFFFHYYFLLVFASLPPSPSSCR